MVSGMRSRKETVRIVIKTFIYNIWLTKQHTKYVGQVMRTARVTFSFWVGHAAVV